MPKLFEGLASNIEVSVCLVAANLATKLLSQIVDDVSLAKVLFIYTIAVNYLTTLTKGVDHGVIRQVSVVALANSLVKIARSGSGVDYIREFVISQHAMPWQSAAEAFVQTTLICMALVWGTRLVYTVPALDAFKPEADRIAHGIQYIFADVIIPLLAIMQIERVAAILGIIALDLLSLPSPSTQQGGVGKVTTARLMYKGLAMGWMNLVIRLTLPDDASHRDTGFLVLIYTLLFATFIDVVSRYIPPLADLVGYVEWVMANTLKDMGMRYLRSSFDVIMLTGVAVIFLASTVARKNPRSTGDDDGDEQGGLRKSTIHIASLTLAMTLTSVVMGLFGDESVLSILIGLFAVTVVIKAIVFFVRSVVPV